MLPYRYQRRPRVIPCLLLRGSGLVKTRKFKDPVYLGDPRNVVRIFNDKEVDELVLLDITATLEGREPNFLLIEEIVSECFAPVGYGGGIRSVEQVKRIVGIGVEKVIMNSAALHDTSLIEGAARLVGSSSVVASLDVKQGWLGKYEVISHSGTQNTHRDPVSVAKAMESSGAGELLLNSIDRDGMMNGYDLPLIRSVADAVSIPVVACGGAKDITDFVQAVRVGHASAAAAGSIFVFHGSLRGVLISFPGEDDLTNAFASNESNS
jgi:imidazole glycerol-phosphate synthase subunit HisF